MQELQVCSVGERIELRIRAWLNPARCGSIRDVRGVPGGREPPGARRGAGLEAQAAHGRLARRGEQGALLTPHPLPKLQNPLPIRQKSNSWGSYVIESYGLAI